jgi:hypothetical protein
VRSALLHNKKLCAIVVNAVCCVLDCVISQPLTLCAISLPLRIKQKKEK